MEKQKFIGYVYRITNKKDGMCYIGQTTRSIEKRFKEHIRDAKTKDNSLSQAVRAYGVDNFEVEELECLEGVTLKQLRFLLLQAEKFYIEHYESTHWDKGYNDLIDGFFHIPNSYNPMVCK